MTTFAAAAAASEQSTLAARLVDLDEHLTQSLTAIAQALDRHLTAALPQVSMLPVVVTLIAPALSVRVPNYLMRPTDTCNDIRAAIMDRMQQEGRKVVATADAAAVEVRHGLDAEPTCIEGGALPMIGVALVAGAELALVAGIASAVELCFAESFASNPGAIIDYFSCKECGVNWICASCSLACHRGHTIVPHLRAHKAEWACCYCHRKCKCTLRKKQPGQ